MLLPPPRTINDLIRDAGQPFFRTQWRRRRHQLQARVALKLRQHYTPSLAGRIKEPHNSTSERKHRQNLTAEPYFVAFAHRPRHDRTAFAAVIIVLSDNGSLQKSATRRPCQSKWYSTGRT
ncbi:Uncharacterised protein [Mycobacteroides abscessus subsp. abscessus]|nr:Uncharacterised protein [Mycobacteroides abscessus subsp. abscessus]